MLYGACNTDPSHKVFFLDNFIIFKKLRFFLKNMSFEMWPYYRHNRTSLIYNGTYFGGNKV